MARLVIDLPPELQERFLNVARERGMPPAELVRNAVEMLVAGQGPPGRPKASLTPTERAARVDAAVGVIAHLPGSVEEFLRQKQDVIDLEEERSQCRIQGAPANGAQHSA